MAKARLHPVESGSAETALPTELTALLQNKIAELPPEHQFGA
ncbi:hypothetical protein ACFV8Z_37740 [Streptomyces sp. NPDC059837]